MHRFFLLIPQLRQQLLELHAEVRVSPLLRGVGDGVAHEFTGLDAGIAQLCAAQQRAAEITAAAQSESRTLRQTVTDYCDNMLKTTEEAMVENAAQVKNVRANLRQNAKKNG